MIKLDLHNNKVVFESDIRKDEATLVDGYVLPSNYCGERANPIVAFSCYSRDFINVQQHLKKSYEYCKFSFEYASTKDNYVYSFLNLSAISSAIDFRRREDIKIDYFHGQVYFDFKSIIFQIKDVLFDQTKEVLRNHLSLQLRKELFEKSFTIRDESGKAVEVKFMPKRVFNSPDAIFIRDKRLDIDKTIENIEDLFKRKIDYPYKLEIERLKSINRTLPVVYLFNKEAFSKHITENYKAEGKIEALINKLEGLKFIIKELRQGIVYSEIPFDTRREISNDKVNSVLSNVVMGKKEKEEEYVVGTYYKYRDTQAEKEYYVEIIEPKKGEQKPSDDYVLVRIKRDNEQDTVQWVLKSDLSPIQTRFDREKVIELKSTAQSSTSTVVQEKTTKKEKKTSKKKVIIQKGTIADVLNQIVSVYTNNDLNDFFDKNGNLTLGLKYSGDFEIFIIRKFFTKEKHPTFIIGNYLVKAEDGIIQEIIPNPEIKVELVEGVIQPIEYESIPDNTKRFCYRYDNVTGKRIQKSPKAIEFINNYLEEKLKPLLVSKYLTKKEDFYVYIEDGTYKIDKRPSKPKVEESLESTDGIIEESSSFKDVKETVKKPKSVETIEEIKAFREKRTEVETAKSIIKTLDTEKKYEKKSEEVIDEKHFKIRNADTLAGVIDAIINKYTKRTLKEFCFRNGILKIGKIGDVVEPLIIEFLYFDMVNNKNPIISIKQIWYKQGDEMRDPEIVVELFAGEFYPISYELSEMGIYVEMYDYDDMGVRRKKRIQAFADTKKFMEGTFKKALRQYFLRLDNKNVFYEENGRIVINTSDVGIDTKKETPQITKIEKEDVLLEEKQQIPQTTKIEKEDALLEEKQQIISDVKTPGKEEFFDKIGASIISSLPKKTNLNLFEVCNNIKNVFVKDKDTLAMIKDIFHDVLKDNNKYKSDEDVANYVISQIFSNLYKKGLITISKNFSTFKVI